MSAERAGPIIILRFVRDVVLTAGRAAVVPRPLPVRFVGTPPRAVALH